MKKRYLLFLLPFLILTGCNNSPSTPSPTPTPIPDPEPEVEDDNIIIINKEDKVNVPTNIISSNLQTMYFENDTVSLEKVMLSYHGQAFECNKGNVTLPNGSKEEVSSLTVSSLGNYYIDFELELYAEILTASFNFTVNTFEEKYRTIEAIDKTQLSIYYLKDYEAEESIKASLFGREVTCNYDHTIAPGGGIISTKSFNLNTLGNYCLVYKYNNGVRDYYCYRNLLSKEKYSNKTGVYASMSSPNSSITITPNVGIMTTLKKGDYIQFNEIIDLSDAAFAKAYLLIAPRFVDTTICFKKLMIKLVDLENSNNYVLIDLLNLGDLGRTFGRAYAYNQDSGVYGASCVCQMFGNPEECQANVFYDNVKKAFAVGNKDNLCGDLDSSSYGVNKWHGFSGNECLMSVYADEWIDGVEYAQLNFDYVDDSREYKVR